MTNCSHRKYLGRVDNWDLMPLASVLAFLFVCLSGGGGGSAHPDPAPAPLTLGHTAAKKQAHGSRDCPEATQGPFIGTSVHSTRADISCQAHMRFEDKAQRRIFCFSSSGFSSSGFTEPWTSEELEGHPSSTRGLVLASEIMKLSALLTLYLLSS